MFFSMLLMPIQVYQHYLSLLAQHVVDVSPQRRWCPAPGCGRSLQLLPPQTLQQQQQQQHGGMAAAAAAAAGGEDDRLTLLLQALQVGRGVDVECDCGCR
jgi:hypothetical protein